MTQNHLFTCERCHIATAMIDLQPGDLDGLCHQCHQQVLQILINLTKETI